MILTLTFVISTVLANAMFAMVPMEWLFMMDMNVGAVCIILMYAMYREAYYCLCGSCDRAVRRMSSFL